MAQEKPAHDAMIFVVDDDDGMRRALGTLLGTVGYKTALFALPSEFLARFKGDEPGCLILDIRMPEMSGLEVQQRLNRVGAMLPVIFITGHGDVPMAVQAMKEGAFQFIQKPFRDQELPRKSEGFGAARRRAASRGNADPEGEAGDGPGGGRRSEQGHGHRSGAEREDGGNTSG